MIVYGIRMIASIMPNDSISLKELMYIDISTMQGVQASAIYMYSLIKP